MYTFFRSYYFSLLILFFIYSFVRLILMHVAFDCERVLLVLLAALCLLDIYWKWRDKRSNQHWRPPAHTCWAYIAITHIQTHTHIRINKKCAHATSPRCAKRIITEIFLPSSSCRCCLQDINSPTLYVFIFQPFYSIYIYVFFLLFYNNLYLLAFYRFVRSNVC